MLQSGNCWRHKSCSVIQLLLFLTYICVPRCGPMQSWHKKLVKPNSKSVILYRKIKLSHETIGGMVTLQRLLLLYNEYYRWKSSYKRNLLCSHGHRRSVWVILIVICGKIFEGWSCVFILDETLSYLLKIFLRKRIENVNILHFFINNSRQYLQISCRALKHICFI